MIMMFGDQMWVVGAHILTYSTRKKVEGTCFDDDSRSANYTFTFFVEHKTAAGY